MAGDKDTSPPLRYFVKFFIESGGIPCHPNPPEDYKIPLEFKKLHLLGMREPIANIFRAN